MIQSVSLLAQGQKVGAQAAYQHDRHSGGHQAAAAQEGSDEQHGDDEDIPMADLNELAEYLEGDVPEDRSNP